MPKFSRRSKEKLAQCHPDIQKVMNEVIKYVDCTIIDGARSIETQKEYVRTGKSKTMNSKHLVQSDGYSHAIDIGPYVLGNIPWNDKEYFYLLAGRIYQIADSLNVKLRWGGNWNGNVDLKDQSFFDLPHWELIK